MKFQKYSSIENAYRERFINAIHESGNGGGMYIVQEKIHGANFSIYVDKDGVSFASRNNMLKNDEPFYAYLGIAERLAALAMNLFHIANECLPEEECEFYTFDYLIINGELAGGGYPHPDVPKSGVGTVQKGVFYNPEQFFIGFDIMAKYAEGEAPEFLNLDLTNRLFDDAGFLRAQTLYRGSLSECLAYPNKFQTTLPEIFGLPEIKDNICEGVVIKPVVAAYLPNGSRVIIKNKNDNFSEKTKLKKAVREIPDNVKRLVETGKTYVTENRFNNVVSKFGELNPMDQRQIGKLIPLLVKDTMEDFGKDYGAELKTLEKKDMKIVQKGVTDLCRNLILKAF